MTVKPLLVPVQLAPPEPIRVLLHNDGSEPTEVELTLKVAGRVAAFRVRDKYHPPTGSNTEHTVSAECLFDSPYYLYDWGPAATGDAIEVIATREGDPHSAHAGVLPPPAPGK